MDTLPKVQLVPPFHVPLQSKERQLFTMASMGHRKMTRIIGAGLPRTGTTLIAAALEILGRGLVLHSREK